MILGEQVAEDRSQFNFCQAGGKKQRQESNHSQ